MARSYIGKKGSIRWYDSTATPFYMAAIYDQMDFKGPFGRGRPEEILVLHRNNVDANMHYVQGSDEAIAEPLEISFSCRLDDTNNRQKLRDVIDADSASAWTVDGDTWVTTKGDTSLTSGTAASVTTPAFADSRKKCSNLEILWDEGSSDLGLQYNEVYYPPAEQEIAEAEDSVVVSLKGMVYGTIVEITSHTAGTAS